MDALRRPRPAGVHGRIEPLEGSRIRTLRRAAGATPGVFRRPARGERKILQERRLTRRYAGYHATFVIDPDGCRLEAYGPDGR